MKFSHFFIFILIFFFNYIRKSESSFKLRDEHAVKVILNSTESSLNFDKYLSNEELDEFLETINHTYPKITKVYVIGESVQNRPLKVLAISNDILDVDKKLLKPKIKLVANRIANEALGRQLLVYLAQFLLENYPQNDFIKHIIDSIEIHILFSMNPDGFSLAKEGDCKPSDQDIGRFSDRYDLNPHIFYESNPSGFVNLWLKEGVVMLNGKANQTEKYYPEIEAVEKWTFSNHFVLSLDLHSGGLMAIFYPYSNSKSQTDKNFKDFFHLTPDHNLFQKFAYTYAVNHPSMNTSECNPLKFGDNRYPVINSAFYNQTPGSMLDYNYVFANCFELSVHLSCCAYPKREELRKYWLENKVALVNYLRLSHIAIKGVITDFDTGEPLEGVFVHVNDNEHLSVSNKRGEYFRLLINGKYNLTFESEEYEDTRIEVTVINILHPIHPFDVKMKRLKSIIVEDLKQRSILLAKKEEEENSLNKKFEGKFKSLKNDFESVPIFKYHSHEEMVGFLIYYKLKFPKISHIYKIDSHSTYNSTRKSSYAFVISSYNPEQHQLLRPEFRYSANSFGSDWIGREMLLLLIKHILESYGKNREITNLVNTTRITIVPSIDPEEFEIEYENYQNASKNLKIDESKIENSKKKNDDLCTLSNLTMRPLDLVFEDYHSSFDIKERLRDRSTLMNWLEENLFTLSGSLYDGQLFARIPPNNYEDDQVELTTQDEELFRDLVSAYVKKNKKMLNSTGCPNDPCTDYNKLKDKIVNGTINGAVWKRTRHTMQDFSYFFSGTFDANFFISCEKKPQPESLLKYWLENRNSLISFIKKVHSGIKGLITDEANSQLITETETVIQIANSETNYFKVYNIYSKGDYFILLQPGYYNVTFDVERYIRKTKLINVIKNNVTRYDIALKRGSNNVKNIKLQKCLKERAKDINLRKKPKDCEEFIVNNEEEINEITDQTNKRSDHFIKYSIIILFSILLIFIIIYYASKTAIRKMRLRRFRQLFNRLSNDDSSIVPLDNEMTSRKNSDDKEVENEVSETTFSVNEVSETSFSVNEVGETSFSVNEVGETSFSVNEDNSKNFTDEVVLLDKS